MPRSATPCAVGLAVRDEVRRKRVNPGTIFSASSRVTAALVSSSDDEITVIVTVGSALGVSPREDVTFTASKKGAGCSVIWMLSPAAGADSIACAKPGADTTMRRIPCASIVNSNRPSFPVRYSAIVAPDASRRTLAFGTARA